MRVQVSGVGNRLNVKALSKQVDSRRLEDYRATASKHFQNIFIIIANRPIGKANNLSPRSQKGWSEDDRASLQVSDSLGRSDNALPKTVFVMGFQLLNISP